MAGMVPADAVAEWRALQSANPPILLADHLTWLRIQGETQDPRLLATLADRTPAGNFSSTRQPLISTVDAERNRPAVGRDEQGDNAPGGGGTGVLLGERNGNAPSRGAPAVFPVLVPSAVPLEPFLQMARRGNGDNAADGLRRRGTRSTRTAEGRREGSQLDHNVYTLLKEHRPMGDHYGLPRPGGGHQEERGGRTDSTEWGSDEAADRCGFLHLVVDGVVFQVEAARPSGITRVWENVLPAVSGRSARHPRAQVPVCLAHGGGTHAEGYFCLERTQH